MPKSNLRRGRVASREEEKSGGLWSKEGGLFWNWSFLVGDSTCSLLQLEPTDLRMTDFLPRTRLVLVLVLDRPSLASTLVANLRKKARDKVWVCKDAYSNVTGLNKAGDEFVVVGCVRFLSSVLLYVSWHWSWDHIKPWDSISSDGGNVSNDVNYMSTKVW